MNFFTINGNIGECQKSQSRHIKREAIQRRSIRKSSVVGGSAVLECDINYPDGQYIEHMIKWHKQGIEVPIFIQLNRLPPHIDTNYQGRVRLLDHASIELSNLRTKDEGWYECSVVFLQKSDDINPNGTWVYLAVMSPPVLGSVSPSFLIHKEGSTAEMFCEVNATPVPTSTWLKDGKELTATARYSITLSSAYSRLLIKPLMKSDAGVYTCVFKNTVAQVSHAVKLVIESNAYIMLPPKNITSIEGNRVRLSCQAEAFPNNITYEWFHDGKDVHSSTTGLMSRAGIYADGSLIINSVTRDDTGWYKCRPSNGLGQAPEAEAYLNVTYLPRVLTMPSRLYLPLGMVGKIECPVEANPPATIIQWSKDGRILNQSHMKVSHQGTLIIRTVQLTDQGQFTCRPYSPVGDGHPSLPIQVLVKDPPYFIERPRPIYQRHAGQSVTMPCIAEGEPKPSIHWRKVEGLFPEKTKTLHNEGNLTIVQLLKEDQGNYECVASNVVASVITSSLLLIEGTKHHEPYNVSVRTTHRSAKVCWLPAYDEGHPQHYVLWYRQVVNKDKEGWTTLQIVQENSYCITVYDLLSNTPYQFMVLSRNRIGDGLFSMPASAITKGYPDDEDDAGDVDDSGSGFTDNPNHKPGLPYAQGPKPAAPLNITVRQQKDGLHIAWLPPKDTTVPIHYYIIQYRTVGQWVPLNDQIVKTWYTWRTPSFGATYQFRVISYSKTSLPSESSPIVTIHTGDPMPQSNKLSTGLIGGLLGGLLLAFLAILLVLLIVRLCRKKQQRAAVRYGSVKYFGPNQIESTQILCRIPDEGPVPPSLAQPPQLPPKPPQSPMVTDVDSVSMLDANYAILPQNYTNHEKEKKIVQETPI